MKKQDSNIVVYQTLNGAVEVRLDENKKTVLLTQQQVAQLFNVQKGAISKHTKNIFDTKELDKKATVSNLETVQNEGGRNIKRQIEYYNLDLILSIGYRINSVNATRFRQWATKTLSQHILEGYSINKKRLAQNYKSFLLAVEDVKKLLPESGKVKTKDVLELVKIFASTWFSLNAYDKNLLPKAGTTKKQVAITGKSISEVLFKFREELVSKNEASELFGIENPKGSIAGIVGNVFQMFNGDDLYPTVEEKAANLLYFMVKNHPFVDGNKRSGAFAFVWFLQKMGILDVFSLTPEALTTLTLLVSESNPKDKEQMIGLILMILKK